MKIIAPQRRLLLGLKFAAATFFFSTAMAGWAGDGTWPSVSGDGDWEDSSKWVGGMIADGAGSTMTLDGDTGAWITQNSPKTVGHIVVTPNWNNRFWYIGTEALTLDAAGGAPTITSVNDFSLWIRSALTGTSGFEKLGNGWLFLDGTSVFTGGVTVTDGRLWTKSAAALNADAPNTVTLNGGEWLVGEYSQTYNNDVVLVSGMNGGLTLTGPDGSEYTMAGAISEAGGASDIYFRTSGGNVGAVLQGDNSYTGNTVIGSHHNTGSVVIRAESSNAFGVGAANVSFADIGKAHDNDALEISGGITVANKNLTLRGQGQNDAGSLRSVSGTNTWSGSLDIGDYGNARVGVDAGVLLIAGQVTGSGADGLTKVGDGTLALLNANSYANGTTILAGTLLAGNSAAVAGGNVTVGDGVGIDTLHVGAGIDLVIADLTLNSSAQLTFELMADFDLTHIDVSGNQIGSDIYTVNILDGGGMIAGTYALLTIDGTYQAMDFVLGDLASGFEGSFLEWNNGALYFHAIPEPQTWVLLGIAIGISVFLRRRVSA